MNKFELERWGNWGSPTIECPRLSIEKWQLPMIFKDAEDYERTKAMIEFCTTYEPELFQQFYKWFKLKGKED